MIVTQLIEKLQALPDAEKNNRVYLEGCDCEGPWNGDITIFIHDFDGPCVLLKR